MYGVSELQAFIGSYLSCECPESQCPKFSKFYKTSTKHTPGMHPGPVLETASFGVIKWRHSIRHTTGQRTPNKNIRSFRNTNVFLNVSVSGSISELLPLAQQVVGTNPI